MKNTPLTLTPFCVLFILTNTCCFATAQESGFNYQKHLVARDTVNICSHLTLMIKWQHC